MTRKLLLFAGSLLVFYLNTIAQLQSDEIFDNSVLHEIRIEFEEDDFWDILIRNYESGMGGWKGAPDQFDNTDEFMAHLKNLYKSKSESKIEYLAGKVTFDGDVISEVGVRLKGFSSFLPTRFKNSIKLDFNEFIDTQEYKGIKKINLNNGEGDPSFQRDFISYYMMRKAGVAAPRVAYAKVYLNDQYWGLYTMVEQVDDTFLKNHFVSGKGNLFKAVGWSELEYINDDFKSYSESIELKTNENKSDGSDYVNLVKSIARLNGDAFTDSIQKLFYVDYFFKVLAIDIMSKNWDSYMMHGRNFYLYHEPISDLFYWIPWDYNLAWDGNFFWGGEEESQCDSNYSFTYDTVGESIVYKIETNINDLFYIDIYYNDYYRSWEDFSGYDTTITITDSTVVITDTMYLGEKGFYDINFNLYYNSCSINKTKKVITADSSDIKCNSIYTMNQFYSLDDVVFDEVFKRDTYCCDCKWDNMCAEMYYSNSDTTVNSSNYPIDFQSEKSLIYKLFKSSDYKNRYYDAFKFVLDSVFNDDKLIQLITLNTDLIRDAVYADTNLIFSAAEFENDIASVCDKNYQITSLTRLIENRKRGLDIEYKTLNYEAQALEKKVNYNDVVINEFMTCRSGLDTTFSSDWIELYNNTSDIIELKNFWLSDRRDTLKYKLPASAVIKPDGYVIVWADNKDKKNGMHAGFKLSAEGEDVLLFHEKYDTIDVISYDYVYEDSTFARIPNGTGAFVIMHPTFNKNNESSDPVTVQNQKQINALLAYPNPASSTLYLQTVLADSYIINMFDTMGKLVKTTRGFGNEMSIDISTVPNGLYILQVDHGGKAYKSKINIEH